MMIKRLYLDENNSVGFGSMIYHCGKYQPINYHALEPGEWWECVNCHKPLVLVTEAGWFVIGEKIQF